MRQAFVDGTGRVVVRDVERPPLRPNGILAETLFSVISIGTESGWVKDRRADPDPQRPDQPLGYSNCGRVVEAGADLRKPVSPGDLVACGGIQMATHSEYCSVPRNLFAPVPPGVQAIEAAFTTLGINAMHGVRQGRIGLGDTVVVVGTGLIGQLAAQLARLCGGRVIVVGYRNAQRLALAAQLGAELAILSSQQDPVQAVLDHTEGFGADVVIMCAASAETSILSQCLEMVRKNGRVVVVGLAPLEIPFYLWHRKEAELLISRAYGPGRHEPEYEEQGLDYPAHFVRWTLNRNMQEFLRLLAEKKLNVRALISHEYRLDDISSVFDDLLERAGESLGIVIRYGE